MFAKKTLITAAALATLAVSAQAQSSVTLYGNVDVAVAYTKNVGFDDGSQTAVKSAVLSESFFGLKGQEDLGNGLKALFKLESSIQADTGVAGGTSFFDKNAYIGLAGDFGAVKFGNQESLFKTAQIAYNAFGSSVALSPLVNLNSNLGQYISLANLYGSWHNAISYESRNYNGLQFAVQHSAREDVDRDGAPHNGGATAVSLGYNNGALGLSAVYGDVRTVTNTTIAMRQKVWLLGAAYDFGVVKAFAQYQNNKLKPWGETIKTWELGAIVPVTEAGALHVSYGDAKFDSLKTKQYSVAYHHALSKRTSAYAGFTRIDPNFTPEDQSTLAVGVRHAF